MYEKITETNKKTLTARLSPIMGLWNKIINTGIDQNTSDFDKKRIRLINGICTWPILIYLAYVFIYAGNEQLRFVLYESAAGVIGYLSVTLINHYRKYNTACHFFMIFNLLFYLYQGVTAGGLDGVQYIFVPSSICAMLFFKDTPTVITYFLANFLFFGLTEFSYTQLKPMFNYHNGAPSVNIANHITMFVILFLIVNYFKSENTRQEKLLERRNISLSDEKQKSENLLMNILPYEIAEELKHTGSAKSRSFNSVTVMFTDFRNFTYAAETLHPEKLVSEINHYFSMFDVIISKYNIEKIKTIGDSYMCAGGLPEENNSNAHDVILAALEIQKFMHEKKTERENSGEPFFECRLGIHTGHVVAGIVGIKKFAYDIWGDTVNIASRMEQKGEVGKVNISGNTYQLVKNHFRCKYRGKIPVKNKGEIDMYFVDSPFSV
jgi:class 3 adenylate cyclase